MVQVDLGEQIQTEGGDALGGKELSGGSLGEMIGDVPVHFTTGGMEISWTFPNRGVPWVEDGGKVIARTADS